MEDVCSLFGHFDKDKILKMSDVELRVFCAQKRAVVKNVDLSDGDAKKAINVINQFEERARIAVANERRKQQLLLENQALQEMIDKSNADINEKYEKIEKMRRVTEKEKYELVSLRCETHRAVVLLKEAQARKALLIEKRNRELERKEEREAETRKALERARANYDLLCKQFREDPYNCQKMELEDALTEKQKEVDAIESEIQQIKKATAESEKELAALREFNFHKFCIQLASLRLQDRNFVQKFEQIRPRFEALKKRLQNQMSLSQDDLEISRLVMAASQQSQPVSQPAQRPAAVSSQDASKAAAGVATAAGEKEKGTTATHDNCPEQTVVLDTTPNPVEEAGDNRGNRSVREHDDDDDGVVSDIEVQSVVDGDLGFPQVHDDIETTNDEFEGVNRHRGDALNTQCRRGSQGDQRGNEGEDDDAMDHDGDDEHESEENENHNQREEEPNDDEEAEMALAAAEDAEGSVDEGEGSGSQEKNSGAHLSGEQQTSGEANTDVLMEVVMGVTGDTANGTSSANSAAGAAQLPSFMASPASGGAASGEGMAGSGDEMFHFGTSPTSQQGQGGTVNSAQDGMAFNFDGDDAATANSGGNNGAAPFPFGPEAVLNLSANNNANDAADSFLELMNNGVNQQAGDDVGSPMNFDFDFGGGQEGEGDADANTLDFLNDGGDQGSQGAGGDGGFDFL